MTDEHLAAARRFITSLFGEPYDDHWWMSEGDAKSPRTGKPITGWYVSTESDPLMITMDWADLTPDDVMVKLYAVIGWAFANGVQLATPTYCAIPPSPGRPGSIYHTDQRDA